MSVRLALSSAVIAGAALSGAAYAQEICDPYSQKCDPSTCESDPELAARNETVVTTDRNAAGDTVETTRTIRGCDETVSSRVLRRGTPTTLPFTGGEIVTLTAVGAGALAGGAALVVAGRRRRPAQDA